jgi:hypothetical protein
MKDIDIKLLSILKQFLNEEIDFKELDSFWIDYYIDEPDDFYYDDLFSEISEFIYMGQKAYPSIEESKDGIIGQIELKIKIEAELIKHPELKEYR